MDFISELTMKNQKLFQGPSIKEARKIENMKLPILYPVISFNPKTLSQINLVLLLIPDRLHDFSKILTFE